VTPPYLLTVTSGRIASKLFANRFLPGLVDRVTKKKVRKLFADEIAQRAKA
jgi:hypothetical protein